MRALLLLLLAATPAVAEPPVPAPPAPDRSAQEYVARAMRWFFGPADAAAAGSAATGPAAKDPASLAISDALDSSKLVPPVNGSGSGGSGNGSRGSGAGALAFGGGWAAGIVIAPPAHPDARPWPHGAVMAPLDTPDANAIAPGTEGLPSLPVRSMPGWSKRIATTLQDGIASLLAFAIPHSV